MPDPKKRFVYIVDSYPCVMFKDILSEIGLTEDEYQIISADDAEVDPSWIDSEKLLVFMSTFHSHIGPSNDLSRKIKAANSSARIIFRSTMVDETVVDMEIYDGTLVKERRFQPKLIAIIKEFFQIP